MKSSSLNLAGTVSCVWDPDIKCRKCRYGDGVIALLRKTTVQQFRFSNVTIVAMPTLSSCSARRPRQSIQKMLHTPHRLQTRSFYNCSRYKLYVLTRRDRNQMSYCCSSGESLTSLIILSLVICCLPSLEQAPVQGPNVGLRSPHRAPLFVQ